MWKLKQMTQMDVIRFARCRELGLLRIIIYLYMLTYVSDTEISPQNNIIKIQRVDISLHQVFLNYSKLPLFSWNLTTAFLHIVSITDAFSLGLNISGRAMTFCFPCFSILSVIRNCVCEWCSFWILYLPILERDYEMKWSIPKLGYVDLK